MDPLTWAVLSNYLASLCKDLTSAAFQAAITAISKNRGSNSMDIVHEFDNLTKELRSIQSFLRDMEHSKLDSESLVNWVEEVKEAARDFEAMTEQIVYYAHALVWDKSWRSKAYAYISSYLPKLKEELVNNIPQRRDRYLKPSLVRREEQSCSSGRQMRQPHEELPHETMCTDVVGMEQNEATVIPWLLGETDNSQRNMVISICGMGGLGKTCLARRVYNDQLVRRHFDCFAWVSISKTYNAEELSRSIIRQIIGTREVQATPDELDRSSRAALLGLLDQCLHQNSRVIVTTRDHHVAASLSLDSHILNLQPLPESEAWSLFCKKALWTDPNKSCPRDLELWARRIVAKCDGLPLAILTLGSLMSSQDRSSLTWKHFYLGISSQLSNNEMLVTMSRSLMLGYDDLPYHLKQCYLYCGNVFPESRIIKKNWLLRLWVAEGLVEDKRGMTSEEVAEGYFDELILRSMLQVARKDESGKVKACRMHILMREVSLCVSKADKLCAVFHEEGVTEDEAKARRISVQKSIEKLPAVRHEDETLLSRLRSLLFFVDDEASAAALLSSLTHLYLLDSQLEATCNPIPHLEKLESLVHLTLLRAYNRARLCFRANTFLRLKSLNIAELKCLSQLDMEKDALPSLSLLHLSRCGDLQGERLHGIDNLPALRHLYLQDMPESLMSSLGGDHRLKASTGWESISKSMSWL
ncbi:disease resistance protein RPM1-like isoform X2 [Musa acuminata AAA Group]|uniref:disease resistance protein RPM1-like isoform X2 n=1 Tax=Musa acuminata AAA Group TaxID=214697 RepID=UPI0031D058EF